jgi:transposase InsO family protein
MPQELTIEALQVALGWRNPGAGLLHHSDRGSQYAAKDYRKVLAARGITVSMSRKGDCWDVSAHFDFLLHETVMTLEHMLNGSSKGFASRC